MVTKYSQAQEKVLKRLRSLVDDSRRMEKWVPLGAPIIKAALERAVSEVGEPPSGTSVAEGGGGLIGPLVESDVGLRTWHTPLTSLSIDGLIAFEYTAIANYTVVDGNGVVVEVQMLPTTL